MAVNNFGVLRSNTMNIILSLFLICKVADVWSSADDESIIPLYYIGLDCNETMTKAFDNGNLFMDEDPNAHCRQTCMCVSDDTDYEYDTICNYVRTFVLRVPQVDEFPTRKLQQFGALTTLVISDTRIAELKNEPFYNLTNLENLTMNNNTLRKVDPSVFLDVPKLETLNLDNNHMWDIDIANMSQLQNLSIKNNKLTDVHLRNLYSLKHLNLDDNSLSTFIDTFHKLPNVEWISLGNNSVRRLEPNMFLTFPKLTFMNLSHNQINQISFGAFEGLGNLKLLDLSHNSLDRIHPAVLDPLTKLEELNLSYNKLQRLDVVKIFTDLSRISIFYIAGNKWSCNDLYEMLKFPIVRFRTSLQVASDDMLVREPGVTNFRGIRCYG